MKIILLGEPKSTSHIYKVVCRGRKFASMYMSKEGKGIKDSYGWQARSQWRLQPLEGQLEVDIKLFFGTKRRVDVDNFCKLLFDSLTGIIWADDSQIQKMMIEKCYDNLSPRIELEIKNQ